MFHYTIIQYYNLGKIIGGWGIILFVSLIKKKGRTITSLIEQIQIYFS
jgi:hypothetical protein